MDKSSSSSGSQQQHQPRTNGRQSQSQPQNKLQQTQNQVDEVVGIMRMNVEKVLERDQKLSDLDARADALREGGKRFEHQAQKLKRKFWWQNLKMMIILGVIAVVILIIIIVSITGTGSGGDSDSSGEHAKVTSRP